MKNIAIIPARGGSKRIPRKNIKDFLGKPIIAYSIDVALNSGVFDEVMVSTNDEEIAGIAKDYGANVPFLRSNDNSNDFASTADVLLEVLDKYRESEFKYSCCIYPTAPFVSSELLRKSLLKLKEEKLDSVFPVSAFSYPIQRSLVFLDSKVRMSQPQYLNSRSQDLEKHYHDAGQFYWLDINKFVKEKKLFTENSGGIILDEMLVQDIDNETDWKLAELKYKLLNVKK